MAGVGLELRKLQEPRSYLTVLRVFSYSLALSVGPWLATIFAVGFISLIGFKFLGYRDMTFFTSTILYVFAGSLIVTGPVFMLFSRYLADRTFVGDLDQRRALVFVQTLVLPASLFLGGTGAAYFVPQSMGNSFLYQLSAAVLFTSLVGLWSTLAYLDFQKRFAVSLYTFLFGSALSVALAYIFRSHGQDGLLAGYAIGMLTCLGLLLLMALQPPKVRRQGQGKFSAANFLSYGKIYGSLLWIGLLYNVGTWIDKFFAWATIGVQVSGSRLHILPPYDIATFMSYLIMMPAISYFLVMVETRFYLDYREYLDHLEKSPLAVVEEKRKLLWTNLKRHMNNLFELELVVGVVGAVAGSILLRKIGLDDETIRTFRILTGAAFFQVLFWINLILLLYFEFRGRALAVTVFFVAANVSLTALNLEIHPAIDLGWGYMTAALISSVISWTLLRKGLQNLNRHIFFINSAGLARPK